LSPFLQVSEAPGAPSSTQQEASNDMVIDHQTAMQAAGDFAAQAASVAGKLKPGTYEAAQALALVSIANSLAVLAEHSRQT
jgi:hypothetical protein